MPDPAFNTSLDTDAQSFLLAKKAPMTPANIQSIKDYLSMNPEQRPSRGADVTGPSPIANDYNSEESGNDIEKRVERSMEPNPNANWKAQRNLSRKTKLGTSESIGGQSSAMSPESAAAGAAGARQGNFSDAPGSMSPESASAGSRFSSPYSAAADNAVGATPSPTQYASDEGTYQELPAGGAVGSPDGGAAAGLGTAAGATGLAALAAKVLGRGRVGGAALNPAARAIPQLPAPPAQLALPAPATVAGGAIPMGAPAPQLAITGPGAASASQAPAVIAGAAPPPQLALPPPAAAASPIDAAIAKTIAPNPRMAALAADPQLAMIQGMAERSNAATNKIAADAQLNKMNAKAERNSGDSSPIGQGKKIAAKADEDKRQGGALKKIVAERNRLKKRVGK